MLYYVIICSLSVNISLTENIFFFLMLLYVLIVEVHRPETWVQTILWGHKPNPHNEGQTLTHTHTHCNIHLYFVKYCLPGLQIWYFHWCALPLFSGLSDLSHRLPSWMCVFGFGLPIGQFSWCLTLLPRLKDCDLHMDPSASLILLCFTHTDVKWISLISHYKMLQNIRSFFNRLSQINQCKV